MARGAGPQSRWYRGAVNLGAPELLIVLLVVLLLFGGAKLPKLARSLGEAQNEFKKGAQDSRAATTDSDKSADS